MVGVFTPWEWARASSGLFPPGPESGEGGWEEGKHTVKKCGGVM